MGLDRIREAARKDKDLQFNNLMHHITVDLLREAFKELKKDAAPGLDEITWRQYDENREENLSNLHQKVQSGSYRATPSKRIWINKEDGRKRPIGMAVVEDKIVQQAVVWILNQIYEEDFVGFSYGFRPGRSQHNALDAIWVGITQRRINWVLDADIRGFFDTMEHEWLMKFIEHRIADKRILLLIRKWLRAGVSEEGQWSKTTVGTPQGAVISPLLSNIYLHYVLDLWFIKWRKQQDKGDVIIVRYADDFVLGFQHRNKAERFLQELQERMAKFGLELHQEKTRLIEFGRQAASNRAMRGESKPETFNFLGFTHICAKKRKGKRFTIHRKTIGKRLKTKIKEIRLELKSRRHDPVPKQGKWIRSVVQGHFNYYAVPGNIAALKTIRDEVMKGWFHALKRRSQKSNLTKERTTKLFKTWIPKARILHPYPNERLRVIYPR